MFVENFFVAFSCKNLLVFIVISTNCSFILTTKDIIKLTHIKYILLNITELNTLDGLWMANFSSSVDKMVTK